MGQVKLQTFVGEREREAEEVKERGKKRLVVWEWESCYLINR